MHFFYLWSNIISDIFSKTSNVLWSKIYNTNRILISKMQLQLLSFPSARLGIWYKINTRDDIILKRRTIEMWIHNNNNNNNNNDNNNKNSKNILLSRLHYIIIIDLRAVCLPDTIIIIIIIAVTSQRRLRRRIILLLFITHSYNNHKRCVLCDGDAVELVFREIKKKHTHENKTKSTSAHQLYI